jgi:hypothetical protein
MKPVLAMPYHDPDGRWIAHLEKVTPLLATLFEQVYLGVSPSTREALPEAVRGLQANPFFRLSFAPTGSQVGDHCLATYRQAVQECEPDQVIHMAYIDRVSFILQTQYRDAFSEDIQMLDAAGAPVLFMRTEKAWSAHPRNYYDCEMMATRAGELLFGRSLDYCWCHCAAAASQMKPVLGRIHSHDFGAQAELVLLLRETLTTREVDWLAWEDPFLEGRNPLELKREREASLAETQKRLGYVIPIMQVLLEYSKGKTV